MTYKPEGYDADAMITCGMHTTHFDPSSQMCFDCMRKYRVDYCIFLGDPKDPDNQVGSRNWGLFPFETPSR